MPRTIEEDVPEIMWNEFDTFTLITESEFSYEIVYSPTQRKYLIVTTNDTRLYPTQ
jgi:hypothetical protein